LRSWKKNQPRSTPGALTAPGDKKPRGLLRIKQKENRFLYRKALNYKQFKSQSNSKYVA
jgi:hypothetical protein